MDRHYEKLESTVPGASNAIDPIRPVKYGYKARVTLPHAIYPGRVGYRTEITLLGPTTWKTLAKVDLTRKEAAAGSSKWCDVVIDESMKNF